MYKSKVMCIDRRTVVHQHLTSSHLKWCYDIRIVTNQIWALLLVLGIGISLEIGGFGLGLFSTYHRTRSSVAAASSTEECPTDALPVWIKIPRFSRTLEPPI